MREEKDLRGKTNSGKYVLKPFKIKGLDITAGLITSTEVGGDYYDFFESNNKNKYSCKFGMLQDTELTGMMVSIVVCTGLPELPVNEILERLNNIVKKINLGG